MRCIPGHVTDSLPSDWTALTEPARESSSASYSVRKSEFLQRTSRCVRVMEDVCCDSHSLSRSTNHLLPSLQHTLPSFFSSQSKHTEIKAACVCVNVCVRLLRYVSHTNISNPGMSLPVSAEAVILIGISGKLICSLFSCLTVDRVGTVIRTSVTTATRLKEPENGKKKRWRTPQSKSLSASRLSLSRWGLRRADTMSPGQRLIVSSFCSRTPSRYSRHVGRLAAELLLPRRLHPALCR
ncbi:hypothetical protein ILYODFUR_030721 [Ilyodon furcidens]|uniref:Uncharacterized protein n=1 Tax=Ilyodon furcidens TaxID=33524 RepID=A0ABV0V8E3_9TELE